MSLSQVSLLIEPKSWGLLDLSLELGSGSKELVSFQLDLDKLCLLVTASQKKKLFWLGWPKKTSWCFAHVGSFVDRRAGMGTRPGSKARPSVKLAVYKPNTRYYPGSNLGKVREPFSGLDMA